MLGSAYARLFIEFGQRQNNAFNNFSLNPPYCLLRAYKNTSEIISCRFFFKHSIMLRVKIRIKTKKNGLQVFIKLEHDQKHWLCCNKLISHLLITLLN